MKPFARVFPFLGFVIFMFAFASMIDSHRIPIMHIAALLLTLGDLYVEFLRDGVGKQQDSAATQHECPQPVDELSRYRMRRNSSQAK